MDYSPMMHFNSVTLGWTEEVLSSSRIIDPLELWSSHLFIQEDFTKGLAII